MLHRTVLAVVILATAMSYAAKAETEAERQACFNDGQTHCGDYIPDRDRVYACLVQKVKLISAPWRKSSTLRSQQTDSNAGIEGRPGMHEGRTQTGRRSLTAFRWHRVCFLSVEFLP